MFVARAKSSFTSRRHGIGECFAATPCQRSSRFSSTACDCTEAMVPKVYPECTHSSREYDLSTCDALCVVLECICKTSPMPKHLHWSYWCWLPICRMVGHNCWIWMLPSFAVLPGSSASGRRGFHLVRLGKTCTVSRCLYDQDRSPKQKIHSQYKQVANGYNVWLILSWSVD